MAPTQQAVRTLDYWDTVAAATAAGGGGGRPGSSHRPTLIALAREIIQWV